MRDERLLLDLCVNGNCDPDGVVGQTVCEFVNPIGQMTEVGSRRPMRLLRNYVQWKMSSSIMRRYPDPDSAWNLIACDAELWDCGADMRSGRIVCTAARPILSV